MGTTSSHLKSPKGEEMSIKTDTAQAIKHHTAQAVKHHLSGIDKVKDCAMEWIACGKCLMKIKSELNHGEYIPYIESN